MSVFQQCWQNWQSTQQFSSFSHEKLACINEFNQAVFAKLEKVLPDHVKVRSVRVPLFAYHTKHVDECHIDNMIVETVVSYSICSSRDDTLSFKEKVDLAVERIVNLAEGAMTIFVYSPIIPSKIDDRCLIIRMKMVTEIVKDAEFPFDTKIDDSRERY